ncbi:MAG: thioredoxin family protein [Burkholderiales bacterium]|nr:thioredoxin family protein [Burkholderiales bacterium]
MILRILLHAISLALMLAGVPASGQPVRADHAEAELIARAQALVPGKPATLGLRIKHDREWHTYWINPGDSGMPTTLQWKLPPGTKAGPIQWPTPKRIPLPPMMNHGYDGEVVLPVEITLPADWPVGQTAKLAARADWLICKDVCIPGGADLTLSMPVVAADPAPDPKWASLFEAAFAAMPAGKVPRAEATTAAGIIALKLHGVKPLPGREVYALAGVEGLVESAAPQTVKVEDDVTVIALNVTSNLSFTESRFSGIVVGVADKAMAFEAPLTGKLVAGKGIEEGGAKPQKPVAAPGAEDLSLALALVFAFLGGTILNLMPCVFPILSLKVLGFARGGGISAMRINGMAFAAGVVLSFLVLAGILLGLRAAGEAIGWGFQLQSPAVVTLLALLFFVIGLNLSGVFEFQSLLPHSLASATLDHPAADSFLSGVLAAVVASPCTAPFMGAALGFAITQGTLASLLVFGALGVGMAAPYVLLAWFPAWLKRLPRPGPWLATFKQFLAFPMYATVVWLAWVLLLQLGPNAIIWFGAALVLIGLGTWMIARPGGGAWRAFAALVAVAGVVIAWPGGESAATPAATSQAEGWAPWSKDEIAKLNGAGTPVFVDFTAAWCVTCQVNKKVVLETRAVRDAFAAKSVKLMRADWTRRDPAITAALAEFGRNGVPVYVLHAPGKPPLILPEILSERIIADALKGL